MLRINGNCSTLLLNPYQLRKSETIRKHANQKKKSCFYTALSETQYHPRTNSRAFDSKNIFRILLNKVKIDE